MHINTSRGRRIWVDQGNIMVVVEVKFTFVSTPITLTTTSAVLTDGSGKRYPAKGGGDMTSSGDYSQFCGSCESYFPPAYSDRKVGFLFAVPETVRDLTFHYDTLPGISISDALNAPSPIAMWAKNHAGETVKVIGGYPGVVGKDTSDLITFTLRTNIPSSVPIEGSGEVGIEGIAGTAPRASLRWGDKASPDSFSSYFYKLQGKNFVQDNRFLVEGKITGETYTDYDDREYVRLQVTSITLLKDGKPSQTWTIER